MDVQKYHITKEDTSVPSDIEYRPDSPEEENEMTDLRKFVSDHFRPNLEWPRHEYVSSYVKCLGDTSEKQQECKFYEDSGDEGFCYHSFDEKGITDHCLFRKTRKEIKDAGI